MTNSGFKIHINNNVLYPGNIVEGVVELNIPKGESVAYNSIRLTLTGKERTRHVVKRKIEGTEAKVEDTERNLFFKEVIVLAGEMVNGNPSLAYSAKEGLYRYPFAYKLPLDIPASVSKPFDKVDYAEILYQAKAVVIKPDTERLPEKEAKKVALKGKPWKPIRAYKVQRYFHVIRPMPLSQYNDKKSIVTDTPFHLNSCGCCDAGNHIQYLDIERSVVAIDRDNLQVIINVDNMGSQKPVKGLQLKLEQTFAFRCNDYAKTTIQEVAKKIEVKQPVAAGSKGVLSAVFPLPLNTIPTFRAFNMKCSYVLLVKVLMDGCKDQEHHYPVTIVQSVDDTNVTPKIVYTQNGHVNMNGDGVKAYAYAPPTASTLLAFNPIPTDAPNGPPATSISASSESALGIPSESWQVVPKDSKDALAHVDGLPVKYETLVWTGGLKQRQVPVIVKSNDVKFKSSSASLPASSANPLQASVQTTELD